jgi:hypothetical protein
VIEVVGHGAMGIVLRAFDRNLQRVVAVKVMSPQFAANATARLRFAREARAAAAVCHEHVVTIHGVEEKGVLPYFVMQFVSGRSLQERIDQTGPLQVNEILRIGMQAAHGLEAAHKQGLVHRDIKPANILLENGVERVKITDFGLARAVDDASLTQSGVIAGTPQYMAPEQARGEPIDHRADLFSLGCVIYTMCTGRAPFRGSTMMAVMKRVCDDVARPVRETNPEIPVWLEGIVNRLMAKDPAQRFQSAGEVAELLERCLAHRQHPQSVSLPANVPETNFNGPSGRTEAANELKSAAARRTEAASSGSATPADGFASSPWAILLVGAVLAILGKWFGPGRVADVLFAFGLLAVIGGLMDVFGIGLLTLVSRLRGRGGETRGETAAVPPISTDQYETARKMVRGPAIGLVVVALVNWFGLIISIFVWGYLLTYQSAYSLSQEGPPEWLAAVPVVVATLFLGSGLMIWGALKMLRLESYGWAVAATVGAMLLGPGYLVGWPVGIWALFVLTRPEVDLVFAAKRGGRRGLSRRALIPAALFLLLGLFTANYYINRTYRLPQLPLRDYPSDDMTFDSLAGGPPDRANGDDQRVTTVAKAVAHSAALADEQAVSADATGQLQRLVELAEDDLSKVRRLFEKKVVAPADVTNAEIGLKNAQIRLAEAQGEQSAVIQLLTDLVVLREQSLQFARQLRDKGVITDSEFNSYEKALLEEQLRLANARDRLKTVP